MELLLLVSVVQVAPFAAHGTVATVERKAMEGRMSDTTKPAPLTDAEWRPIPGFDGYEASSGGRVRSFLRGNCKRLTEPHLKLSYVAKDGYARVRLSNKTMLLSRCILSAFAGLSNLDAEHLDGNRTNNNLANLAWSTRSANERRKALHGTAAHGERHPSHKLTADKVRQMRDLRAAGRTYMSVAREFGVALDTAQKAIGRRTWKNI